MLTTSMIGFQNAIIDDDNQRIGTNRGFAYNFFANNTTTATPYPYSTNQIFYFADGQINALNNVIVKGTNAYDKYTGGTLKMVQVSPRPNFVAEITLFEPITIDEMIITEEDDQSITVVITKEGGYYQPFIASTSNTTNDEIGYLFQNQVYAKGEYAASVASIGTYQGFAFTFSEDKDSTAATELRNHMYFLGDDQVTLLNEAIVLGTGAYSKYTGGSITEKIISSDPDDYMVEVTFNVVANEDIVDDKEDVSEVSFLLNSGVSTDVIHHTFRDSSDANIGELYQMTLFDEGVSAGTISAYNYNFPPIPTANTASQGNRYLLFEDGDVTVFNEIIVQGTGAYVAYTGGTLSEVIVSTDPVYSGRITLTLPPDKETASSNETSSIDVDDNNTTMDDQGEELVPDQVSSAARSKAFKWLIFAGILSPAAIQYTIGIAMMA